LKGCLLLDAYLTYAWLDQASDHMFPSLTLIRNYSLYDLLSFTRP